MINEQDDNKPRNTYLESMQWEDGVVTINVVYIYQIYHFGCLDSRESMMILKKYSYCKIAVRKFDSHVLT